MRSVVFLDLDNTFWSDGVGVPASTVEAIHVAQSHGHKVFSNTGRARAGTRDLTPYGLDGRCYAAGAEVFVGDEKICDLRLTLDESRALRDALDIGSGILVAEGGERCFVRAYDVVRFEELKAMLAASDDPFIDHPDLSVMTEDDHMQVFKYSLFVAGGVPQEVKEAVPAGFVPTSMRDATEFTRKGVSKAQALELVRRFLEERDGISYRTVAIGDSANDVPMLRAADVAVTMGNGTDEAKAAADYVTATIDEDGLYKAFEHLGLLSGDAA